MMAVTLTLYVCQSESVLKSDEANAVQNRNFLFQGDWMQPYHRLVPGILEKMPILVYAVGSLHIARWSNDADSLTG